MTRRVRVSPMTIAPPPPEAAPLKQPSASPAPELSIAVREVLGLPALLLCELPLPSALLCRTHAGGHAVLASSSAAPVVAAPAFVGPELSALLIATEHDRANWAVLGDWCERKAADPLWRLTSLEALGGFGYPPAPRNWTWARVLRALGLQLEEVLA